MFEHCDAVLQVLYLASFKSRSLISKLNEARFVERGSESMGVRSSCGSESTSCVLNRVVVIPKKTTSKCYCNGVDYYKLCGSVLLQVWEEEVHVCAIVMPRSNRPFDLPLSFSSLPSHSLVSLAWLFSGNDNAASNGAARLCQGKHVKVRKGKREDTVLYVQ